MGLSVSSPELEDKKHMDIAQADKETDIKITSLTSSVSFVLIFIIITSSLSLPIYFLRSPRFYTMFPGENSLSLSERQTIKDKQHFEHWGIRARGKEDKTNSRRQLSTMINDLLCVCCLLL